MFRSGLSRPRALGHDPGMTPQPPRGLALLRLRAENSFDARGRIADCDGIAVASSDDGQALWIGDRVGEPVAIELTAAFDRAPPGASGESPPAFDACERILASAGVAVRRTGGSTYVIPPGVQLDPTIGEATEVTTEVTIKRSGGPGTDRLRCANPGNWAPVEWDELLDGTLGPWALAMHGERAISICHTPGPMTPRAAECGVWTDPAHRGRGHAAATVAAWVPLVSTPQRILFYSTEAENLSSQRVARRLQLEPLGWTWWLRAPRPRIAWHPLSSLAIAARKA